MRHVEGVNRCKSIFVIMILIIAGSLAILLSGPGFFNVRAGSTWTQTSDKDFNNNATLINLTVEGSGEEAVLEIDFSDLHNWKNQNPASSVGNLAYHSMATIYGTDKTLIFGGANSWNSFQNETWEYDLSANGWTNKNPTNAPGVRGELGMAPVYGHDKVVLFGGRGSSWMTHFGDTWVYDSSDGAWSEKSPGNTPSGRSGIAMASIYGYDKVLLFGGSIPLIITAIYNMDVNILFVLMLIGISPMGLDGFTQLLGLRKSNNILRLLSGFIAGFFLGIMFNWLIVHILILD